MGLVGVLTGTDFLLGVAQGVLVHEGAIVGVLGYFEELFWVEGGVSDSLEIVYCDDDVLFWLLFQAGETRVKWIDCTQLLQELLVYCLFLPNNIKLMFFLRFSSFNQLIPYIF